MRASAMIAGVLGAVVGYGASVMFPSRAAERPPQVDAAPASGGSTRWNECLARLDAIDAHIATLAAPASVPVRTEAEEPGTTKIAERLAAIEAALAQLATTEVAKAKNSTDPPRHVRDVAAFERLFEAEYAKRQGRRDDHLGYTADRLYERYGAPDYIWADPKDEEKRVNWAYNDSTGSRGVMFYLRDGTVVGEDPWTK